LDVVSEFGKNSKWVWWGFVFSVPLCEFIVSSLKFRVSGKKTTKKLGVGGLVSWCLCGEKKA
jgi:hypothetical protein